MEKSDEVKEFEKYIVECAKEQEEEQEEELVEVKKLGRPARYKLGRKYEFYLDSAVAEPFKAKHGKNTSKTINDLMAADLADATFTGEKDTPKDTSKDKPKEEEDYRRMDEFNATTDDWKKMVWIPNPNITTKEDKNLENERQWNFDQRKRALQEQENQRDPYYIGLNKFLKKNNYNPEPRTSDNNELYRKLVREWAAIYEEILEENKIEAAIDKAMAEDPDLE